MTVFKYFLKNASRRKSFLIVYFLVLMGIAILNTSGSIKRTDKSFAEYKPKIAVVNEAQSESAKNLERYCESISFIRTAPDSLKAAREMVFMEMLDAVVYIPGSFEENLLKGSSCVDILYDHKNIKGHIAENRIFKYLLLLKATESHTGFDPAFVDDLVRQEVEVVIREKTGDTDSYRQNWYSSYFRFSAYMITAVVIGVIGLAMSDFQKNEMVLRIQASSTSTIKIQSQTYLGQLSVTFFITFLVILSGMLIQKGNVAGADLGRHMINLFLFSLSVLSLTFMINNITGNKHVKSALSTVLSLGMAFLSGVMIPQEYLGDFTLKLARMFPMYYFVKVNDNPSISSGELYLNLGIQLGFAVVFLLIGVLIANLKRKKGKAG